MHRPIEFVVIDSGSPNDTAMAQAFLESHGIPVRLFDEHIGTTMSWIAAPGGAGAVKVAVAIEHAQNAQRLLSQIGQSESESGAHEHSSSDDTCLRCSHEFPEDVDVCPSCGWSYSS